MDVTQLRFTATHEWVRLDGEIAVIGITDFAVHQLTDLVFIELPPVGKTVTQSEIMATVESVKAAGDVYAPVSGEVVEANTGLAKTLAVLSEDPFGRGWLVKIRLSNAAQLGQLMNHAAYVALTAKV